MSHFYVANIIILPKPIRINPPLENGHKSTRYLRMGFFWIEEENALVH